MKTNSHSKSAFLTGSRLYLRALGETDADGPYPDWFNDAEVCRGNSHHAFPYTREAALEYIRRSVQTPNSLILAILLNDGDRHIGNIALQDIHPLNRSAELSILIGERDVWGAGFAFEAAELIVTHGFAELNLQRIGCGTFANNEAMQKLALRLGMKEEGRRRHAVFKSGSYQDVIEFGLLRSEFEVGKESKRSSSQKRGLGK